MLLIRRAIIEETQKDNHNFLVSAKIADILMDFHIKTEIKDCKIKFFVDLLTHIRYDRDREEFNEELYKSISQNLDKIN